MDRAEVSDLTFDSCKLWPSDHESVPSVEIFLKGALRSRARPSLIHNLLYVVARSGQETQERVAHPLSHFFKVI